MSGIVEHTCNHSTKEVETGRVLVHLGLSVSRRDHVSKKEEWIDSSRTPKVILQSPHTLT